MNLCDVEGEISRFGVGSSTPDVGKYILDLLRPLGITEQYIGVRQLIQAVEMVMENPDYINALQKEVCTMPNLSDSLKQCEFALAIGRFII